MSLRNLFLTCIVCSPMWSCTADEDAGKSSQELDRLLTLIRQTHALPDNTTVRVETQLYSVSQPEPVIDEAWEFTANHVHRIQRDSSSKQWKRAETRPLKSDRLCSDLLAADVRKIEKSQTTEDGRFLVRSLYSKGNRRIRIVVGPRVVLDLRVNDSGSGFSEEQATAFAILYERVSSQARVAFGKFPHQKKLFDAAANGTWPKNTVLLIEIDAWAFGNERVKQKEAWGFDGSHIYLVQPQQSDNMVVYERVAQKPFDSRKLAAQLIDGRFYEICTWAGEGGAIFALTPYRLGGRFIHIEVDGAIVHTIGEHCAGGGYGQTQSEALTRLFETLARQARSAFDMKK